MPSSDGASMRMARVHNGSSEIVWLTERVAEISLWSGIDAVGWQASTWVLNAMYSNDSIPSGLSHDEVHKIELAAGTIDAVTSGNFSFDDIGTLGGWGLGFTTILGPEWSRMHWLSSPHLRPSHERTAPPSFRWFGLDSWPANVQPPTEGSLDEASALGLLKTLAAEDDGWSTEVIAYYGGGAGGDSDGEHVDLWQGPLGGLGELVRRYGFTPTNFWAADRTWFVYTDCDLWATKVSGSQRLVEALKSNPDLETVDWSPALP